jgi:hypothetical protein
LPGQISMNAFPSVCGQSRHRSGRRHWRAGPILGSAGGRGCATGTTSVRQDDVMPFVRRAKPPARAWWRDVSWRMPRSRFGTRRRTDTDEQTRRAPGPDAPRRSHPSAMLDVAVRNDELLVDEAHLATLADSEPVVVAVDALASVRVSSRGSEPACAARMRCASVRFQRAGRRTPGRSAERTTEGVTWVDRTGGPPCGASPT